MQNSITCCLFKKLSLKIIFITLQNWKKKASYPILSCFNKLIPKEKIKQKLAFLYSLLWRFLFFKIGNDLSYQEGIWLERKRKWEIIQEIERIHQKQIKFIAFYEIISLFFMNFNNLFLSQKKRVKSKHQNDHPNPDTSRSNILIIIS